MKKNLPLILIIAISAILRLWNLNYSPAGLNADEAALGYNAFSLIQTGHDEHKTPWPIEFRSFDDYKPGVYVYLAMPFIYLFGLNEWTVRLPSAILGVASIYLIYRLVNLLFSKSTHKLGKLEVNFGHLVSLLLAITPWHIHFSRGGWEANVGTFLVLFGLVLIIKAFKNPDNFIFAAISWSLALYTYHSTRLVVPLLGVTLVAIYNQEFLGQLLSKLTRKKLVAAILLGLVMLLPLIFQFMNGSAASRFSGVGIFADTGPLAWVHEMRRNAPDPDGLFTKIQFNRYTAYAFEFVKNYLSHFSPNFLFVSGDEIARSKVPGFGQSLHLFLPFFYIGIFALLKSFKKISSKVTLAWLLISPVAAALTFQSPHALRAQNMVIPFTITTAVGIMTSITLFKNKVNRLVFVALASLVIMGVSINFGSYLNSYFVRYPKELGFSWQYGFDQLGAYLSKNQEKYDKVIISTAYDQPYILIAFYLQYPPTQFQEELVFSQKDKFGFSTGLSFGKYEFHPVIWSEDSLSTNSLIVLTNEESPKNIAPIHTIYYPNGQPVFRLYDTNQYLATVKNR